ncbi:MAG TPA: hypothetical protein PKL40_02360 [Methanoregulaceae archaeon]|nr:hypothetical protein [Methanoregulaceae archaeon]
MAGINISWDISGSINDSEICDLLSRFGCKEEKPTNPYQKWILKGANISIIKFEKKLVVQGKENDYNRQLLKELSKNESLTLDKENNEKFIKLFRIYPNAILCMECSDLSMLIKGEAEKLDIKFRKECGHVIDMHPPIYMVTNRILPDVNVLVAGLISKLIRIGYLGQFEIILPHFTYLVIDTLGKVEKERALDEIKQLRSYDREGKLSIFNCNDGYELPPRDKIEQEEDDIFLKIARLTNSILFTGDHVLMEKALANKRPTIYIHPKDSKTIYTMAELRNPS